MLFLAWTPPIDRLNRKHPPPRVVRAPKLLIVHAELEPGSQVQVVQTFFPRSPLFWMSNGAYTVVVAAVGVASVAVALHSIEQVLLLLPRQPLFLASPRL